MAIDMAAITTFAEVKKLSDEDLIEYAKLSGVVLEPQPRKDLISKCASIFLSKKSNAAPELPLTPAEPVAEAPQPVASKKKDTAPKAVVVEKKTKAVKGKTEEKSQKEMELAESFEAGKNTGQDFPRCPYCGAAITVDTGVRDGNNKPVCKECTDKVNKSKEKVMKATAKANKVVAKKAAKKTSRKGNTDALKKAREAAPKDEAGFREGSKTSLIFLAIQKGAAKSDKLKAIRPNAISVIAGFQKKASENSVGIEAVIKHDEEAGTYKLKSFKNSEGKTVHIK